MSNLSPVSVKTHFLLPSAIFVSREPYQILTILGSCVAVCLWDSRLLTGGMNHFMLPLWNGQGLASPKYGNIAIEKLLDKILSMGSRKEDLKAKVFGGGVVIQSSNPQFNIGQRNIDLANEFLDKLKIKIISANTGGRFGRKIMFNTQTGEVKHKLIEKTVT